MSGDCTIHTFENRECVGHPSGVLLLSFDEPRDEASGTRTAQEKFRLTMPSLLSRAPHCSFTHQNVWLCHPPLFFPEMKMAVPEGTAWHCSKNITSTFVSRARFVHTAPMVDQGQAMPYKPRAGFPSKKGSLNRTTDRLLLHCKSHPGRQSRKHNQQGRSMGRRTACHRRYHL